MYQVSLEEQSAMLGMFGHDFWIDGQWWTVVGFRGRWIVLENEDERTRMVTLATAQSLLDGTRRLRAQGAV